MRELYSKLNDELEKLDFEKIYPGFQQYDYAIYNNEKVWLKDDEIPYDNRFIGNTAIDYEGKRIAIWDLKYSVENLSIFASLLVHEMFHCHQFKLNETRFGNEFQGMFYQLNEINMNLKINEINRLLEAYEKKDLGKLKEFVAIRKRREELFAKEVLFDKMTETIEGMAHYVELKALRQLDEDRYQLGLAEMVNFLKDEKNYLKFRHFSYMSGTMILILCDFLNIDLSHEMGTESRSVFDLLTDRIGMHNNNKIPDLVKTDMHFLQKEIQRRNAEIKSLREFESEEIKADAIIGYDPMNSYGYEKNLVFKNFLLIKIGDKTQTIFGNGIASIEGSRAIVKIKK